MVIRTSILFLANVTVAMTFPDINSELLGFIVIEWFQTLVPASIYCVRHLCTMKVYFMLHVIYISWFVLCANVSFKKLSHLCYIWSNYNTTKRFFKKILLYTYGYMRIIFLTNNFQFECEYLVDPPAFVKFFEGFA